MYYNIPILCGGHIVNSNNKKIMQSNYALSFLYNKILLFA